METLIYPSIILIIYTILCIFIKQFTLVYALRSKHITLKQLPLLISSENQPKSVIRTTYNLKILYQSPLVFYIITLLLLCAHIDQTYFIYLSWAFVLCQILSSIIRLISYNNFFIYQLILEMVSNSLLLATIIMLLIECIL
jgi:hypothetical protein